MSSRLTPDQRTLRARVAAHAQHAAGRTNTAPAREALRRMFEQQVDPDGVLVPDELARRVLHARKSYFSALALKSSVARSKAKKLLAEAEAADVELGTEAEAAS